MWPFKKTKPIDLSKYGFPPPPPAKKMKEEADSKRAEEEEREFRSLPGRIISNIEHAASVGRLSTCTDISITDPHKVEVLLYWLRQAGYKAHYEFYKNYINISWRHA